MKSLTIIIFVTALLVLSAGCKMNTEPSKEEMHASGTTIPTTSMLAPSPSSFLATTTPLPLIIEFFETETFDKSAKIHIKTNYLNESNYKENSLGATLADAIKSDITVGIEWLKTQAKEFPVGDGQEKYTFIASPSVTHNSAAYISLYYDYYMYSGGAHGNTTRVPYTYSSKGKRIYDFTEIVKDKITLSAIENEINRQIADINQKQGASFYEDSISLTTTDKLPSFYIRDGVMIIYYQPYDIAPYAYGIPEFAMPDKIFSIN